MKQNMGHGKKRFADRKYVRGVLLILILVLGLMIGPSLVYGCTPSSPGPDCVASGSPYEDSRFVPTGAKYKCWGPRHGPWTIGIPPLTKNVWHQTKYWCTPGKKIKNKYQDWSCTCRATGHTESKTTSCVLHSSPHTKTSRRFPYINIVDPPTLEIKSSSFISGRILPNSIVKHFMTIDSTVSSMAFVLTWDSGDLNLILYTPNGTKINPLVAATDPFINYSTNLNYKYYSFTNNPEPGNWTVEIAAKDVSINGAFYGVISYVVGNITLSISTDKNWYNPNEEINIIASLRYNNAPFIEKTVMAEVLKPNGEMDKVTLFDDGTHGDAQANDGNYSNTYTNTSLEGSYDILVHASGMMPSGDYFTRQEEISVVVETIMAKFNNSYFDYGTDVNDNGYYDYLSIDVGINVSVAGNYNILGELEDDKGTEIDWASSSAYLYSGNATLELDFDGRSIQRHGINGSYHLKNLTLIDETGNIRDYRYEAFSTAAYNYTDFEPPLVIFVGNYSDRAIDVDGNGLYDYLAIGVEVNVSAAGYYDIAGWLYGINGSEIAWADNYTYLDIGNKTVQLKFDGKNIQKHGMNGPYYLKKLTVYRSREKVNYIDYAYTTGAYNFTDFEAPLAMFTGNYTDYGIDFDSDGFYDYLTVDVGVNVITAGNYSVLGQLYDANGSEIIWSIDYGSLDVGDHTMHLDFDGKTIQMHGVNGPYYLKHLRLSGENWTFIDYIPDAYNTSAYNYSDFVDPVSTENEVTISGVGLGEIRLIVSFTDTIPVFAGRYSYDLVGINIPQRPNNFTITTSEVKNLKVGVKKIQDNTTRIWVTQTIAAPEGIATVQSDLPSPGNYHVKIFGDAVEGASEVDLELTAVKKITASGDFSLSIDISGFPAGKYTVTATADTGCFTDLTLDGLPLAP